MPDFDFIFKRFHPRVHSQRETWLRADAAYSGGASYIDRALIRHVSEISLEFEERKQRACYFNYPRKIARFISQFVLAEDPQRTNADPAMVEDFSRNGLRCNEVMRQVSTCVNTFGMGWLLIDMPPADGETHLRHKKSARLRPYAIALKPWEVADWAYAPDGRLLWAIVEENREDRSNPFASPSIIRSRRLWTRDGWELFTADPRTGEKFLQSSGTHGLGQVQLIKCEEADGFGINANHWFEDVVRISDAILNAESEAQMNIIKQMFGLLVVSESFRNSDFSSSSSGRNEQFSHLLARSAALWESPEEKGITRYISPCGATSAAIREEIKNLKLELFDVIGLAVQGEQSSRQSAEAKAWDHHHVSQFLMSRVDMIEQLELQAWELIHRWDPSIAVPSISYNREFSVVDLEESVQAILNINSLPLGTEFRREISRTALKMLEKIKKISPDCRTAIEQEINA